MYYVSSVYLFQAETVLFLQRKQYHVNTGFIYTHPSLSLLHFIRKSENFLCCTLQIHTLLYKIDILAFSAFSLGYASLVSLQIHYEMIDSARVFLCTFERFNDAKINWVWNFPSFFSLFSLRGTSNIFFLSKEKKKKAITLQPLVFSLKLQSITLNVPASLWQTYKSTYSLV